MSDFRYYNINPNMVEENDCVCRAISRALNLPYYVVENLLDLSAKHNGCDCITLSCYRHLLEGIFELPVRFCEEGETVSDIANAYPHNVVLIRIEGHLSVSLYSVVNDLWDCRDKQVTCYWVVS